MAFCSNYGFCYAVCLPDSLCCCPSLQHEASENLTTALKRTQSNFETKFYARLQQVSPILHRFDGFVYLSDFDVALKLYLCCSNGAFGRTFLHPKLRLRCVRHSKTLIAALVLAQRRAQITGNASHPHPAVISEV